MAGISASGNSAKNKSHQKTETVFPIAFLREFENKFGRGFSPEEILASLPESPSLFGGGGSTPPASSPPLASFVGPQSTPAPARNAEQVYTTNVTGEGTVMQPGATTPPGNVVPPQSPGTPGTPGNPLQLPGGIGAVIPDVRNGPLPEIRRNPPGAPTVGVDVQGGLANLGFGARPPTFEAPNIRDPRRVQGATADAATIDVPGGGGYDRFENALFESRFRPVERELNRQSDIEQRRLQSQLAQSGLASSGSGLGLLQQGRTETQRQVMASAQDAANQSTAQRYGVEVENRRQEAANRQTTALANAGFDMDAQKTNADNILRGDTARADAYLKTIGLEQDAANQQRKDFLSLLGLQQADLERLDSSQRERASLALNAWLQTFAQLRGAGLVSEGSSSGKSAGGSAGLSVGS